MFRGSATPARIVKVLHDDKVIANASADARKAAVPATPAPSTFTVSLWVKPDAETPIPAETQSGFSNLYTTRNDIIFPAQGSESGLGEGHAGGGFAVGTNGVCVYEHSGQYFVPILAHAAPIRDWTFVTVVYDKGSTFLYLNGKLAHTGLKTAYQVRPGEPNTNYRGSIGGFRRVWRALPADEVLELMKSGGPPGDPATGDPVNPLQLVRDEAGKVRALAWRAGNYKLEAATGPSLGMTVPALMAPQEIGGAWTASFPPESGAPANVTIDQLASLTGQTDPTIKYFSGTVTYTKAFDLPAAALAPDRRLFLDLGEVGSLAEVTLNGKNLGTLWCKPFRLDVSGIVKGGANRLQVRVTNVWHNRLVGQRLAPQAFNSPTAEKIWTSMMPDYGANEPLFPTGLIGPVILRQAAIVEVR